MWKNILGQLVGFELTTYATAPTSMKAPLDRKDTITLDIYMYIHVKIIISLVQQQYIRTTQAHIHFETDKDIYEIIIQR